MTVRLRVRAFVSFISIYFCVGMNQECVPLGHWDRLLLNQYKQIADLMVNLSEFPETVGAFCLPAFFISLDRADVYNAGKVTLCCGSESVLGHYSLSAAHHHWSQKGLNTYMDKKKISIEDDTICGHCTVTLYRTALEGPLTVWKDTQNFSVYKEGQRGCTKNLHSILTSWNQLVGNTNWFKKEKRKNKTFVVLNCLLKLTTQIGSNVHLFCLEFWVKML